MYGIDMTNQRGFVLNDRSKRNRSGVNFIQQKATKNAELYLNAQQFVVETQHVGAHDRRSLRIQKASGTP